MRVYIVTEDDYDYSATIAVFSDESMAHALAEKLSDPNRTVGFCVEEFFLDKYTKEQVSANPVFMICVERDGEVASCGKCGIDAEEGFNLQPIFRSAKEIRNGAPSHALIADVIASTLEEAIEIAQKKRLEVIASGAWDSHTGLDSKSV